MPQPGDVPMRGGVGVGVGGAIRAAASLVRETLERGPGGMVAYVGHILVPEGVDPRGAARRAGWGSGEYDVIEFRMPDGSPPPATLLKRVRFGDGGQIPLPQDDAPG